MPSDLTFTGERFLPDCAGEIAYEHWHRYAFARQFATGKRVLDAACGEGYGTALLGAVACAAVGVDIDAITVAHAQATYGDDGNGRIRFLQGSCTELPLPDASVDLVVSFETVEHLQVADQPRMLAEFARVLTPEGLLVISSPNKRVYSDEREYVNEFHLHELYREGLAELLAPAFAVQRWYHQRVASRSEIWAERLRDGAAPRSAEVTVESWLGDGAGIEPYTTADGMYFVVLAARSPGALPAASTDGSLFTDREGTEQKRSANNAREVLRLDTLLAERDAALDRQTGHVRHLETLVAEQDAVLDRQTGHVQHLETLIAEQDAVLEKQTGHLRHLETLIAERENIIGDMDRRLVELNEAREFRERLVAERDATIAALQGREATLNSSVATLEQRIATLQADLTRVLK